MTYIFSRSVCKEYLLVFVDSLLCVCVLMSECYICVQMIVCVCVCVCVCVTMMLCEDEKSEYLPQKPAVIISYLTTYVHTVIILAAAKKHYI